MGAPEFVPAAAARRNRTYSSPPRRPESWLADRPGELDGPQPEGDQLGNQGPDQGYLLTLAEGFRGKLSLHPGEHEDDALAGGVAVGLKRASLYGRAPVVHDLTVGLGVWGFLDPKAPKELVAARHPRFEEVHHPYQYTKLRAVADAVSPEVLRQPHQAILDQAADNWKSVLTL